MVYVVVEVAKNFSVGFGVRAKPRVTNIMVRKVVCDRMANETFCYTYRSIRFGFTDVQDP